MIAALTGLLTTVDDAHVELEAGAIVYTLLIASADSDVLRAKRGETVTFFTVFYLAGDAARGNLEPTLIGFLRAADREFFNLFTTVKGIGVKTALRALTVPISEIAHAIESRDTRALVKLDGVGKRTAELIVAELAGKAGKFVESGTARSTDVKRAAASTFNPEEERAISRIVAGGDRRADAEALLLKVRQQHPEMKIASELWRAMIRARG